MSGPLRKRRGFTALPNETVYDADLSYRALGLLLALNARPESSSFDLRRVLARSEHRPGREGRDACQAAAKELRDRGYLAQRQVRVGREFRTLTLVDVKPMTTQEAAAELDDLAREQGYPQERRGPGNPAPHGGPGFPAPKNPALSSTKSQPPTSTRFARGVDGEESNARECEHGEPRGPRACALCRYAARSAS